MSNIKSLKDHKEKYIRKKKRKKPQIKLAQAKLALKAWEIKLKTTSKIEV